MFTTLAQAALVAFLSLTCWKVFRLYLSRSCLENIPGPPRTSWLGVLPNLFADDAWNLHDELTKQYGRIIRIYAPFQQSYLYVSDPLALHHIVVKDQYTYEEASAFIESCRLFFGQGLLAALGDEHKRQRKLLNPAFSTSHIRKLYPEFERLCKKECDVMCDSISQRLKNGQREVDMLTWMSRLALELVGQCGLGYSFDDLVEDEAAHPFCVSTKRLTPTLQPLMLDRNYILPHVSRIGTPAFRRYVLDMIPWKGVHDLKDVADDFTRTADEIYDSKLKALDESDPSTSRQMESGNDILSILMRANMHALDDERLSESEIKGQIITLCFSATDTTSTALARTLELLSKHQDVQDGLRSEIRAERNEGQISYDALMALPYLDAICKETLRLYPPVPVLQRVARRDIYLPLYSPIVGINGASISGVTISNGTNILISTMAINRDKDLWNDDAHEWKPARWLKPLPEAVTSAPIPGIYGNQLTFLGGARACIGLQFSQLEMKVVLSMLVDNFRFVPVAREIVWKMSSIVSPSVHGEPDPKLPLLVSFAPGKVAL